MERVGTIPARAMSVGVVNPNVVSISMASARTQAIGGNRWDVAKVDGARHPVLVKENGTRRQAAEENGTRCHTDANF